ncbi:hypothetical protein IJV79_03770 [bacterium]|nr:hypothetical protein [bacterium]
MKKILVLTLLMAIIGLQTPAFADGTVGKPGKVSGLSVGAAAVSLIIWPGLGQLMLDNPVDKNVTHAVLGLTGVFRFWSCYDAFVDRKGGVWHNRI